jgi:hypothetical protein
MIMEQEEKVYVGVKYPHNWPYQTDDIVYVAFCNYKVKCKVFKLNSFIFEENVEGYPYPQYVAEGWFMGGPFKPGLSRICANPDARLPIVYSKSAKAIDVYFLQKQIDETQYQVHVGMQAAKMLVELEVKMVELKNKIYS